MTSTPFPAGRKDPLLVAAKVVAIFVLVMIAIGIGALIFATPVVLFKQAEILAELAKEGVIGQVTQAYWAIVALMIMALLPLGLTVWFVRLMIQLIDSTASDDPFTVTNADRLARMGWLSLAIQLCGVPLGAMALWLSEHIKADKADLEINIGFSGSGLVLMLVLFILSRIFRHGAAMREELEGTV
jgi:hypothetical protein